MLPAGSRTGGLGQAPGWLRPLDRFVPDAVRAAGPESLQRARLLVGSAAIGSAGFFCAAILQLAVGTREIGYAAATTGVLLLLLPLLLERTARLGLLCHVFLVLVWGFVLAIMVASGGGALGALLGMCILPLAAVLLGGRWVGAGWTFFAVAVLIAVGLLSRGGAEFPLASNTGTTATPTLLGAVVSLAALASALVYDLVRGRAFREIAEAYARAETEHRRRAEADRALRDSEERLGMVLDATSEGVWDWNVKTGEVFFSPHWFESLGYAPGELRPHVSSWEALVHPDDMPRVRKALQDHFEGCTPIYECENRLRTRSGEWRQNLDRGRVVERDADGNPVRMVGVDVDITQRKRADESLQQARKLESLGVLAGGIAHDFNNLLVGIKGNAELARLDLDPDSPAYESVADIEKAARRASELANHLLVYAGRGQRRTEPLDLAELVEETVRLLRSSVPREVAIEHDVRAEAPGVDADPAQIRQVVINLIINAAEATGPPGTVRVRTGLMQAGHDYLESCYLRGDLAEGAYAYVEVEDRGCGMDGETLAKMFDPFFTTKFNGRGLGLASALGIVRGHGGTLKVDSDPGWGTRFRLLFPATAVRASDGREQTPTGLLDTAGTILVVDDDEAVLSVTRKMLTRAGFDVLTTTSGRDAVAALREHPGPISAAMLDVTMPELDGPQTFEQLRRLRADLPVLFFSGHSEEDGASLAAGRRRTAFVHKPFSLAQISEKLAELLLPEPGPPPGA